MVVLLSQWDLVLLPSPSRNSPSICRQEDSNRVMPWHFLIMQSPQVVMRQACSMPTYLLSRLHSSRHILNRRLLLFITHLLLKRLQLCLRDGYSWLIRLPIELTMLIRLQGNLNGSHPNARNKLRLHPPLCRHLLPLPLLLCTSSNSLSPVPLALFMEVDCGLRLMTKNLLVLLDQPQLIGQLLRRLQLLLLLLRLLRIPQLLCHLQVQGQVPLSTPFCSWLLYFKGRHSQDLTSARCLLSIKHLHAYSNRCLLIKSA
mmetsp:Transcript_23062/g.33765  ORF Transcript_23062/g.33765 Transcript_23062/m.33765 type:complete len:258 (+) Transcript_23062:2402-3175(+)